MGALYPAKHHGRVFGCTCWVQHVDNPLAWTKIHPGNEYTSRGKRGRKPTEIRGVEKMPQTAMSSEAAAPAMR